MSPRPLLRRFGALACAALLAPGAFAQEDTACDVDGGELTFADGTTAATIVVDGTPDPLDVTFVAPSSGPNAAWVITDDELNILALPPAPPFDLDGAGVGTCLIWYLRFEDGLEGAEMGANAADLAGCFDLSNPLTVERVAPDGDDGACAASAGTLVPVTASPVTLGPDGVGFDAAPGEAPVVPDGYEVVYVLTTSDDLVIQDIYPEPSGYVLDPNTYRLHTLVAELSDPDDANFLDASIIEFGTTPAGAVLDVIAGAGICADLFVEGAAFEVVAGDDDGGDACVASAGTLVPVTASPVTLGPDGAAYSAAVGEAPVVPEGYEVVYVITTSDDLVIQDINDDLDFYALDPNTYRVHTLVAELSDSTDADFLDASIVEFGTTTAADVLAVVAEAGICADLFVEGAAFTLVDGEDDACDVDGGEIAFADGATAATIVVDGTPDPLDVEFTAPSSGPNAAWVITDDSLNILALPPAPPFDLDGAGVGTCLIWYLRFEDGLEGATVGANAADLAGCFDLSNPLTVERVAPDAGGECGDVVGGQVVTPEGNSTLVLSSPSALSITPIVRGDVAGDNQVWIVTVDAFIGGELISQVIDADDLPLELDRGAFRVYYVSYDGELPEIEIGEAGILDLTREECIDVGEPLTIEVRTEGRMSGLGATATQVGPDIAVTLTPTATAVGAVEVLLSDRNGRVVAVQSVGRVDAATTVTLPVAGQVDGLYVVTVRSAAGLESRLVSVQ